MRSADAACGSTSFHARALRLALVVVALAATAIASPIPAHAAAGDGTYQWWFTQHGCTYTQTFEGGFQTAGRIDGRWQAIAQAVGGNNIRWIRLEAWAVGWAESGLFGLPQWVKIGNKINLSNTILLSGKRTEPVTYNFHSTNLQLTNLQTMPSTVGLVFKISWRRQYGKGPFKKWKTKKKTSDFFETVRLSGNQILSDVKDYVLLQQCKNVPTGSRPGAKTGVAGASPSGALSGSTSVGLPRPDSDRVPTALDVGPFAALDQLASTEEIPAPGHDRSFEGITAAETAEGVADSRAPPEPALAVGNDRLLVAGGGTLNVLDKTTGARIGAPRSARGLWAGLGGPCADAPGDARVATLFDEHAGRFVVARTASAADAEAEARACLAVSATGDPSGVWHAYDKPLGTGLATSDVRLASWPNSFLLTTSTTPIEPPPTNDDEPIPPEDLAAASTSVVAFGRAAALAGGPVPSLIRGFPGADGVTSLAPVDVDADGVDPAAPALLVGTAPLDVLLYRLTIDWSNPAAAAVSQAISISGTAPISSSECQAPCAAQPPPGEPLDIAYGRIGARPVLHRHADGELHLALAVSTDAPYWVDVADPLGDPSAAGGAEISSAGGSLRPFHPSVVADTQGGHVVAVHGSSATAAPGIFYEEFDPFGGQGGDLVGASVSDAAVSGLGSSFGPDTAALRDPSDDCRVWIAGQSQRTATAGDWSVRITSFRSSSCPTETNAAPTATFTMSPSRGRPPLNVAFNAGGSTDPEAGALTHEWSFGDGGTGSGSGSTHEYADEGVFRVRLVVTDPDGKTATMTRLVEVVDDDQPPAAGPDDLFTKVGLSASLNVISGQVGGPVSDWDPDGGPVTMTGNTNPAHGTVACSPEGACIYTPEAAYSGGDRFEYTLRDDEANVVTGVVSVDVRNRGPQLEEDGLEAGSGTPAVENVFANDKEPDPTDQLTLVSATPPAHGTVDCSEEGTCVYQSTPGFVGVDRFEYTATDGELNATSAVDVFVAACPDLTNAIGNGSSLISGWEWIECASPEAHDETTLSPAGLPRTGPAALMTSGSAALAAPPNTEDGAGADLGTAARGAFDTSILRLDLQVPEGATCLGFDAVFASDEYPEYVGSPFNDAFLAELDESNWSVTGSAISAPNNFALDAGGRILSVNSVLFGGVVTHNGTEYDGSTPPIRIQTPITPGSHSLYLSIFDASDHVLDSAAFVDNLLAGATPVGGCTSGVNVKPTAGSDTAATLEDTPVNVDVLANDSDSDGTLVPSTLHVVTPPAAGTATVVDGKIAYAPAANASGAVTLTYEICDNGGACATATVTITIVAVNDPPVANNDSATTGPGTAVDVDVLANDTDVEGSTLTVSNFSQGANGTVALVAGKLRYTPGAGFGGSDAFTYRANDGTVDSNEATVTVTDGNVAPAAADDAATTNEDTPVDLDVLANDTDADGDTLSVATFTQPAHGGVALVGDLLRYTPAPNYHGTDTFTYRATDGTEQSNVATVTITVTPVNDPPVASDSAPTTPEDTPLTSTVSATDADGDTLTYALVGIAPAGLSFNTGNGSFTYAPASNLNGSVSFQFKANDGTTDSNVATVTIMVTPVNDRPVAAAESYATDEDQPLNVTAPGVLGNDGDIDGDALMTVLQSGPANGALTLNPDGSFTYTPGANFHGTDSFQYRASDGSLVSTPPTTVTITVNPLNDTPVANDSAPTTPEDTPLSSTVSATDADGDTLTYAIVGPTPAGLTFDTSSGSFTHTPAPNFHGSVSFQFKATAGGTDSNVATVTITVTPVNDRPTAALEAYETNEDQDLNVPAPGVLSNDADIDGDTLTTFLQSGPTHGALTLNADGSLSYSPAANFNGTDSFQYRASDGGLVSTPPTTVTLTVRPVSDPPVASDDAKSALEDTPLSAVMPATDADGDSLTFALVGEAPLGLSYNTNGSYTFTPATNFNGTVTFDYRANDGDADSNTATVTIVITPVNDTPVATNDAVSTNQGVAVDVDVLANDTDVDGPTLGIGPLSQSANGSVAVVGGQLRYTPNAGFSGTDSFTYRATDGSLQSGLATVTITVRSATPDPNASCTITGTGGNDTLTGGPGNDVICSLGGNDRIDGGGGNDVIKGGAGADTADGGEGNDVILGETGNDNMLEGGAGNDVVLGGIGHDKLVGSGGDDQLRGENGRDWLLPGPGVDVVDGGADRDKLDFKAAASAVQVDLAAGSAAGDGNDTVSSIQIVLGSAFADRIEGSDDAEELSGYNGNDTINGRGGNDFIDGGRNTDACDQGPGTGEIVNCEGRVAAGAAATSNASSTFSRSNQIATQMIRIAPTGSSFTATFTWESPGSSFLVTAETLPSGPSPFMLASVDGSLKPKPKAKRKAKIVALRLSVRRGATYMVASGSVPKKYRKRGAKIRFKLRATQLAERTTVAATVRQRR